MVAFRKDCFSESFWDSNLILSMLALQEFSSDELKCPPLLVEIQNVLFLLCIIHFISSGGGNVLTEQIIRIFSLLQTEMAFFIIGIPSFLLILIRTSGSPENIQQNRVGKLGF